PRRAAARPREADAAAEHRGQIVVVAFELGTGCEQLVAARVPSRGDEAERDRRRARAQSPLERDAVDEAEPVALDVREERERAQREVRAVARKLVRAFAGHLHLELVGRLDGHLVPAIERGGSGVEAGSEVRARGGCDNPHGRTSRTAASVGSTGSEAWPVRAV